MGNVQITNTVALSVGSTCTLGDLRAFLDAVKDDTDSTRVRLSLSRGGQMDPDTYTITVNRAGR